MPIKRKAGPYTVTPEVRSAAGYPERWERIFGGPREGRAAWLAIGGSLCPATGGRPECWWFFTAGVPDELREPIERPDPRPILYAPPTRKFLEASAAANTHARARFAWLIGSGHLSAGELVMAEQRLRGLERPERRTTDTTIEPDEHLHRGDDA